MEKNYGNLPKGTKIHLGKGTIHDIQFSPDSTRLAVANSTGIWIYDAPTSEELFLLGGHTRKVTSVVFSPSGHQFASGSEDSTIRIWDATTGTHQKTYTKDDVKRVVFSPDRHTVATIRENSLRLWDIKTDNPRQTLTLDPGSVFLNAVFSSDGGMLAISEDAADMSDDGCPISLWDVATATQLKTLTVLWIGASCMAFSPDGRILANEDGIAGYIYFWDVATGTELKPLTGHKECVYSLAFSPDGFTLASGCGDGTVLLWDVATGERLKTLTGHTAQVSSICFSPDGNTLASGCEDGTVLLWDVDSAGSETTFNVDRTKNETILTEENTEFLNRESQIQQICQDQGITTLVHFTEIKHLQSILHEGLLSRSILETRKPQPKFNDPDRFDEHKDAICLSISFPNFQLFNKFSRPTRNSPADYSQWAVLLLKTEVLWELNCAFCQENASSKTVTDILLEKRKKADALRDMFVEVYCDTKIRDGKKKETVYRRQSLRIPDYYPTHPQAEVLVFNRIQIEYIRHYINLILRCRIHPRSEV